MIEKMKELYGERCSCLARAQPRRPPVREARVRLRIDLARDVAGTPRLTGFHVTEPSHPAKSVHGANNAGREQGAEEFAEQKSIQVQNRKAFTEKDRGFAQVLPEQGTEIFEYGLFVSQRAGKQSNKSRTIIAAPGAAAALGVIRSSGWHIGQQYAGETADIDPDLEGSRRTEHVARAALKQILEAGSLLGRKLSGMFFGPESPVAAAEAGEVDALASKSGILIEVLMRHRLENRGRIGYEFTRCAVENRTRPYGAGYPRLKQ